MASAIGLVVVSCSGPSVDVRRYEIETRNLVIEASSDGVSDEEEVETLRATRLVWATPDRIAMRSFITRRSSDEGGESSADTATSRWRAIHEVDTGRIWTAESEGAFVESSRRVVERAIENRRRLAAAEELAIALRRPDLDGEAGAAYRGDGSVQVEPASGVTVVSVAVEPGVDWVVMGVVSEREPEWALVALWMAFLDVTRDEAMALAAGTKVQPLAARGIVLTEDAARVEITHRIVDSRRSESVPEVLHVPPADRARSRAELEALSGLSVGQILERLLSDTEGEGARADSRLVLAIEDRLTAGDVPALASAWRAAMNADLVVELARVGLRRAPGPTLDAMREDVAAEAALPALGVVEALAAEGRPEGLELVVELARRRHLLEPAVDELPFLEWAAMQARAASGWPRDRLLVELAPFWRPAAAELPVPTRAESLARELEFWFDVERSFDAPPP